MLAQVDSSLFGDHPRLLYVAPHPVVFFLFDTVPTEACMASTAVLYWATARRYSSNIFDCSATEAPQPKAQRTTAKKAKLVSISGAARLYESGSASFSNFR